VTAHRRVMCDTVWRLFGPVDSYGRILDWKRVRGASDARKKVGRSGSVGGG
jgi:hypothetical protein